MELIDFIKQFIRRQYLVVSHYPREHLYMAAALGGLFIVLLLLPTSDEDQASNPRAEISLEIELNTENIEEEQAEALALPDVATTTPEIKAAPVLEDVPLWKNVEIKSGDNLSAIFTKVGLVTSKHEIQ